MPGKTTSADGGEYDFILVGAGSASCLIASRLSQRLPSHQILVLEAGEDRRDDPKVLTPGLSFALQGNPHYDWQYSSVPEPGLNDRRVNHPRGKLVGGTSAINSHSVVFPNHEWHDRIAEELLSGKGKADWTSQGMKVCYERWQDVCSEPRAEDGESTDRVRTSYPREMDVLQSQWAKAFEELGHKTGTSRFVESSAGAVNITNAVDSSKGERSHAGTALLEPALKRGNVTLKTGVKVGKIVFADENTDDGKLNATGVQYTFQGGDHTIKTREVIVCGGVFESPSLLERSGIGSKKVLAAANVPVLYELPGVGENLQDHLNCGLSWEVKDDVPTRDDVLRSKPEVREAELLEYKRTRSGRLSEGPAYSFAFTPLQMLETPSETQELTDLVRHSVEEEPNPRLKAQYAFIEKTINSPNEATATTLMLRCQRNRDGETFPELPVVVDGNYITIVAMLAHPFSRGSCHITSDPSAKPEIKFNYLSHPLDTEIFARHIRLIERLFQTQTLTAITKPNGRRLPRSFPHPVTSLKDAKDILPINAATNYHPCGTCSMMREDLAGVVDERLRVYGTKNVRVCDASVLPIIPRGNILTAVYAFAEKAVEMICREAGPTGSA